MVLQQLVHTPDSSSLLAGYCSYSIFLYVVIISVLLFKITICSTYAQKPWGFGYICYFIHFYYYYFSIRSCAFIYEYLQIRRKEKKCELSVFPIIWTTLYHLHNENMETIILSEYNWHQEKTHYFWFIVWLITKLKL